MIWNDEKLRDYFGKQNYAKLNPASIDLSLSQYVKEARWFWNTPLAIRKLIWLSLGKPNPWEKDDENIFWGKEKLIGFENDKESWYWLGSNKLVLLSAQQEIVIPIDSAGILVTTSTSGRIGFNHSHSIWFDPGFIGYPTFEYVNLAQWPIPLWQGLKTIQLVMFDLNEAAKVGYGEVGRYQNQSSIPQTIKKEVL